MLRTDFYSDPRGVIEVYIRKINLNNWHFTRTYFGVSQCDF